MQGAGLRYRDTVQAHDWPETASPRSTRRAPAESRDADPGSPLAAPGRQRKQPTASARPERAQTEARGSIRSSSDLCTAVSMKSERPDPASRHFPDNSQPESDDGGPEAPCTSDQQFEGRFVGGQRCLVLSQGLALAVQTDAELFALGAPAVTHDSSPVSVTWTYPSPPQSAQPSEPGRGVGSFEIGALNRCPAQAPVDLTTEPALWLRGMNRRASAVTRLAPGPTLLDR